MNKGLWLLGTGHTQILLVLLFHILAYPRERRWHLRAESVFSKVNTQEDASLIITFHFHDWVSLDTSDMHRLFPTEMFVTASSETFRAAVSHSGFRAHVLPLETHPLLLETMTLNQQAVDRQGLPIRSGMKVWRWNMISVLEIKWWSVPTRCQSIKVFKL